MAKLPEAPKLNAIRNRLRGIFGAYTYSQDESASFNETLVPNYRRLRSDFLRMCPPDRDKYACAQIPYDAILALIQRLDGNLSDVTRSDLYTLESYILALASDEYLLQAYPGLKDRYRALAGAQNYKTYEDRLDPKLKAIPLVLPAPVREDALYLMGELRRLSIAIPKREELRSMLLYQIMALCGVIAAALGGFLIWWPWWHHFPYLLLVALFSMIGGALSVSRRLQSTPDEELNLAQWGRASFLLSPITSIGFGTILYYIISGGLITGSLLPDFTKISNPRPQLSLSAHCDPAKPEAGSKIEAQLLPPKAQDAKTSDPNAKAQVPDENCTLRAETDLNKDGSDIIEWIDRLNYAEFAKLIVWAFIAGFAEQLVPDTLDSLISRQKLDSTKK